MRRELAGRAVMIAYLLFLVGISFYAISPAAAFTIKPYTIPDQCIVMPPPSVFPPVLRLYDCRFGENKVEANIYGAMTTAPPGLYRNITIGKECRVGKGGVILSCKSMSAAE